MFSVKNVENIPQRLSQDARGVYLTGAMAEDYSGKNLRGRSFRGKNLEGANFSYADIRSVDFSGASLIGANFSHAKAGLQRRWAILLVLVALVLMGLSGVLSAFSGVLVALLLFSTGKGTQPIYQIAGWATIVTLVLFFFITIRQGIQQGLGAFAGAGAGALALALALAVAVAVAVAVALALALAVAVAVALAGAGAGAFAFAFAVALVLCSIYISWRALKGDPRHALIRDIAIAFAAFKGTSFHGANLTDGDFTQARLKSTDFRKANLTRAYWFNAQKLDRVRYGTTYLKLEYLQSLPPEAQQALLVERGATLKMLLEGSRKANPEISIVTNNSQHQENEPRNINIDEGNYNEDIKGNYIQGNASNE